MNRETGFWLAVALLSIAALGVSATTIESTLTTEPDDVIDLDYDTVPIGQDDAQTILDEMGGEETGDRQEQAEGDDGTDSQTKPNPDESSDSVDEVPEPSDSEEDDGTGQSDDMAPTIKPPEPSLLERLLDLLAALLPYVLFIAAVLGSAGLTVRYRDRIIALFDDPDPPAPEELSTPEAEDWLDGAPSNDVDRVWVELVDALDLDRAASMTTTECATAAIDAGYDPDAVRTLTEAFEELRYGGQFATDRHERLARSSRRQLDLTGSSPRSIDSNRTKPRQFGPEESGGSQTDSEEVA